MVMRKVNDPDVQRMIEEANRGVDGDPADALPEIEAPLDTIFPLAAGYMQDDGTWATTFEVRELTGRDEEALSRINDRGRAIIALVQRGTVRVGSDEATPDVLNGLVGGDWDTLLLAIRAVSFGSKVDISPTCDSCRTKYEVTIDVLKDIPVRTANFEEMSWTLEGKRDTYEVSLYTGEVQRKIFEEMSDPDKTVAVLNTEVLMDSISSINGVPVLGKDVIRDLPLSDRRMILKSLEDRRVGPDLRGVTIKCPTCGNEQPYALNVAALFQ